MASKLLDFKRINESGKQSFTHLSEAIKFLKKKHSTEDTYGVFILTDGQIAMRDLAVNQKRKTTESIAEKEMMYQRHADYIGELAKRS